MAATPQRTVAEAVNNEFRDGAASSRDMGVNVLAKSKEIVII
jgi:hypothetical protein